MLHVFFKFCMKTIILRLQRSYSNFPFYNTLSSIYQLSQYKNLSVTFLTYNVLNYCTIYSSGHASYTGTKNPVQPERDREYVIPDIFQRFGGSEEKPRL